MRKLYEKPVMVCQEFSANEYVAACGDSGTTYLFTCEAGGGAAGYVESDDGTVDGHYHACGIEHEAESTDVFINGTYSECILKYDWLWDDYVCSGKHNAPVDVVIWTGENNNNIHCTTNLDRNDWETGKS